MLRNNLSRCQAAVAVLTLFILPAANAADFALLDAASVQKVIQNQHAAWEAQDNWVSQLPKDQIIRMLGVQTPPDNTAEFSAPAILHTNKVAVGGLDWRNKDGVNWVSPILNQGNCGSCVAFASVATLETQFNITSAIPGLNQSFSTQALFVCGGGACEFGWQPELASQYLKNTGVPDEACAPYTMGATGNTVECGSVCSDATSRNTRIVTYRQPSAGTKDINSVKAALAHGPLMTTLMVYADFLTYHKGVYKHVTGTMLGGHAISIIGYDDASRSWLIRNSWGNDWGNNGFANISWDDVSGVSNETWSFDVPTNQGYITVRNPHGRAFISGNVDFQAESSFPQTNAVALAILNPAGQTVKTLSCASSPCTVTLDTTSLADGRYEVVAEADWSGGKTLSEHEQFFIFNAKPAMNLTYTMADSTDLTKPLVDRIVFNLVSTTGGSVPLSTIRFHAAQNGQEVYTTHANIVLPTMTMGWRTNTVPDGAYDIWFTGEITAGSNVATFESAHTQVTTKNGTKKK